MNTNQKMTRRTAIKALGICGWAVGGMTPLLAVSTARAKTAKAVVKSSKAGKDIWKKVSETSLIDTHEHLPDEQQRLGNPKPGLIRCDDWSLLFSHYLDSDLVVSGMPKADHDRFLSADVEPGEKWKLLAPWWPAVRNTGYGQATRIAIQELYGVDEVSGKTVSKIQEGYERTRRPGFYERVLRDQAGIESCQVNSLTGEPFKESAQPQLLMQDISIVGMFVGPSLRGYGQPTGINIRTLADWHAVIRWWFEKYSKYAVAVKSQNAYSRDIDYARVTAERAEPVFAKVLQREPVTTEERKLLEDHLFWYSVDQATAHTLPVKIHTGYYAGQNAMPLGRLQRNMGSACELCRLSPETRFVFMHLSYPYYEEMLALAKQYANAHVDMCWSWIISPVAAKDYLKKHIVTAPMNKLLPFGGDYIPVEPVLGHARIARRGIAQALTELVDEGWLSLADAIEIVEPLLNGNAKRIFALANKSEALKSAQWVKPALAQ